MKNFSLGTLGNSVAGILGGGLGGQLLGMLGTGMGNGGGMDIASIIGSGGVVMLVIGFIKKMLAK